MSLLIYQHTTHQTPSQGHCTIQNDDIFTLGNAESPSLLEFVWSLATQQNKVIQSSCVVGTADDPNFNTEGFDFSCDATLTRASFQIPNRTITESSPTERTPSPVASPPTRQPIAEISDSTTPTTAPQTGVPTAQTNEGFPSAQPSPFDDPTNGGTPTSAPDAARFVDPTSSAVAWFGIVSFASTLVVVVRPCGFAQWWLCCIC